MTTVEKRVRAADDFYATPIPVIETVRPFLPAYLGSVLDPAAGDDRFCRALGNMAKQRLDGSGPIWYSIDIAPKSADVAKQDFLTYECPPGITHTIITNPPFSLIEPFIEHAFELKPRRLIFLARLALLASQRRYELIWRHHPPRQVVVQSRRPSFTGGGTDNSEYAWFLWGDVPGSGIAWVDWKGGING